MQGVRRQVRSLVVFIYSFHFFQVNLDIEAGLPTGHSASENLICERTEDEPISFYITSTRNCRLPDTSHLPDAE
jgi:hypothetical protein